MNQFRWHLQTSAFSVLWQGADLTKVKGNGVPTHGMLTDGGRDVFLPQFRGKDCTGCKYRALGRQRKDPCVQSGFLEKVSKPGRQKWASGASRECG